MVTRSHLKDLLERNEAEKVGVYLLIGEESGELSVYVGETENFTQRIKSHLEKDFWNKVILFINKDDNLTKAHVQYLEQQIHAALNDSGRVQVVNSNTPEKGKLPEADEDVMMEFLDSMVTVLGVLGYSNIATRNEVDDETLFRIVRTKRPYIAAHMRVDGDKYIVLSGSELIAETRQLRENKLSATSLNFVMS